jgi:four helix bundle protein
MNTPEVTMNDAIATTDFIAHEKAIEAAGITIRLAMRVPAPLRPIADQAIRSASSVAANLAEGRGRSGRDRLHFYRIGYASAKEIDSHLRLLARAGVIDTNKAERALAIFDEVRAMTWRLLHPKP